MERYRKYCFVALVVVIMIICVFFILPPSDHTKEVFDGTLVKAMDTLMLLRESCL